MKTLETAGCLSQVGRFQEAEALLPEVRDLFRAGSKPLDRVRLRWQEGRIAFGLGRVEEAETVFRRSSSSSST